jgi:23S rRNA G2445 N2-methylase RlmL
MTFSITHKVVNSERRIKKHIHGRAQTFEIESPPGFLELCERVCSKLIAGMPAANTSTIGIKTKNGRLQIENAPFELCHELLLLGLPFADVKVLVFRGRCSSDEKLQAILEAIDWEMWIPSDRNITWDLRVDSSRSHLYNESRIKEKVQKLLSAKYTAHNTFSELQLSLDFRLERESLEVLLSLGGRNYWQRGHKKTLRHAAPLREDLAACLVHRLSELQSEWTEVRSPSLVWNPFCGTGTLLHESALFLAGCGRALGDTNNWPYKQLPFFKAASFQHREKKIRTSLRDRDAKSESVFFLGEDKVSELVSATLNGFKIMSEEFPLDHKAEVLCHDSTLHSESDSQVAVHSNVWLLANPPFGMRLSNASQGGTEKVYEEFAKRIRSVGKTMLDSNRQLNGVVLCASEENWLTLKKILGGWRQRCEHFTLGGLDIRAFYFSNARPRK